MAVSNEEATDSWEFNPPPPAATPFPAADLQARPQLGEVEFESLPVRRPPEDLNDVKIVVRGSVLTRCRAKLAIAAEAKFPWYELALALSSLAAGAVAGAIPADIQQGSGKYLVFFTILPVVAIGAFVAYLFLRHQRESGASNIAQSVLSELPDPEKAQ